MVANPSIADDASFIAGELLVVDGAYSVGTPLLIELNVPLIPDAVR